RPPVRTASVGRRAGRPQPGPPRTPQPPPQPHRLQGLPLRRQRPPRRRGSHPRLHHGRPRHRPGPARGRPHARLGPHRRPRQPPHRPPRPQPRGGRAMPGRWTHRVSAAGVLVLAAAAFTLSYDALHHLALDSRVRPGLAWLWPVVIDGTIVVALLTVLAAKRADIRAGYPWALAGLFSAASVAFNIAHAPDRPVAQLVFAMAPIALVLTTHLLMQQASWRRPTPKPTPRTRRPTPPHPSRPVRIMAPRWAPGPGFGRPTKHGSRPGRPQP